MSSTKAESAKHTASSNKSLGKSSGRKESFGPEKRVKRRAEFLQIQARGTKHSSKHFLIAITPRTPPPSTAVHSAANTAAAQMCTRIGITVTKKVDKRAAHRNRLKRRVRECFRKTYRRFQGPPVDLVVIARDGATECEYEQVRKELHYLLYQAQILVSSGKFARKAELGEEQTKL